MSRSSSESITCPTLWGLGFGLRPHRCRDWLLRRLRNRRHPRHWRDEAIASAGDGLNMPGIGGGVAEGFAKFVDGCIQPVIEIHERVLVPQPLPHLFARHQLGWPFQKHHQHLEGLRVELEADTLLAQLSYGLVCLEHTKAKLATLVLW